MLRHMTALLASVGFAFAAVACGEEDTNDADSGTDTGSDSEADAGSDASTDTDTDTDTNTYTGWMGCSDYNDCRWVCQDDATCEADCTALLSETGAAKWNDVMYCVDTNCGDLTWGSTEWTTCFTDSCGDVWDLCWEDRGLDPDYVEVGPYCQNVGDIAQNVFWFDADGVNHEFAHDFYGQYPAILLVISAAWCSPCAEEAALLPGLQTTYGAENLAILQLLTDGTTQGSAVTTTIVQNWQDNNMGGADLAGGSLAPTWNNFVTPDSLGQFYIPFSVVIDGATMEITAMGDTINEAAIQALMP
jgi:hypothetical protein